MALEALITFRHMNHDNALDATIQQKVVKLERFFDRISKCEVVVEAPNAGHHNKGAHFRVRIALHVPGEELVVDRDPAKAADHDDPAVAIRDAFEAAKRKLQDYTRRRKVDKHRDSRPELRG